MRLSNIEKKIITITLYSYISTVIGIISTKIDSKNLLYLDYFKIIFKLL